MAFLTKRKSKEKKVRWNLNEIRSATESCGRLQMGNFDLLVIICEVEMKCAGAIQFDRTVCFQIRNLSVWMKTVGEFFSITAIPIQV